MLRGKKKEIQSGKTLESLKYSHEAKKKFIQKYGSIPTSILVYDKSDKSIDLLAEGSYEKTGVIKQKDRKRIYEERNNPAFHMSGAQARSGGLSRFPQNIGRLLVKFYCTEGGTVYDPFAGHNSRMQLVFECGRNYIGIDVCKRFMEQNRKVRDILLKRAQRSILGGRVPTITLIEKSSENVPEIEDASCDFTITSPPYWNIEYYGDEPEQLGNTKTYQMFLTLITQHIKENYRILSDGAYCCYCINDFKSNGVYYAFHADLLRMCLRIGFKLHGIYIIDLGRPLHATFPRKIEQYMLFPKRHEYCLVLKKEG